MDKLCKNCNSKLNESELSSLYSKLARSFTFRVEMATIACESCKSEHILTQESLQKATTKEKLDMYLTFGSVLFAYSISKSQGLLIAIVACLIVLSPIVFFMYKRSYKKAKEYFQFELL